MGSVLIAMVCDADLCAKNSMVKWIRNNLTLENCQKLYTLFEGEEYGYKP